MRDEDTQKTPWWRKHYRRGFRCGRLSFLNGGEFTMRAEMAKRPTGAIALAHWRRGYENGRANAMGKTRDMLTSR